MQAAPAGNFSTKSTKNEEFWFKNDNKDTKKTQKDINTHFAAVARHCHRLDDRHHRRARHGHRRIDGGRLSSGLHRRRAARDVANTRRASEHRQPLAADSDDVGRHHVGARRRGRVIRDIDPRCAQVQRVHHICTTLLCVRKSGEKLKKMAEKECKKSAQWQSG